MRRVCLIIALAILLGTCASPSGTSGSYARDKITREDIGAILPLNAYGAIRRLRPRWLSGGITVYENGHRVDQGGVYLSHLRIEDVVEMRYVEHDVARMVYGYNIPGGVIEVDTTGR